MKHLSKMGGKLKNSVAAEAERGQLKPTISETRGRELGAAFGSDPMLEIRLAKQSSIWRKSAISPEKVGTGFLSLSQLAREQHPSGFVPGVSGDGEKFELCGGGFCWARLHRSGHICEGRRHLCYVAPAGEASAGEPIAMLLLNENEVAVQTGDDSEVWRRCKPAIS